MGNVWRLCVVALVAVAVGVAPSAGATNEARGVWMSASQTAKTGETAEQTAERLANCGFTMVLPRYEANSEALRNLIAACHRHHLQVHVWLFRPPVETKDEWRCLSYAEAKQQMVPGQACLCEEAYLAACEEKVRQIVREYDMDGIHFDEVGYGRPWQSLCDRCRHQFMTDTGLDAADWPNNAFQFSKITRENRLNTAAWGGPDVQAFIHWRSKRLALYLRRLCDAARSVRPMPVSYAAMPEPSADEAFYGEDLAQLAKVFDFMVPMSYYTEYGGTPEWTGETCRTLAEWIHRGNPNCQVYGGISAYGADGGWREPIRDLYKRLVAEGVIAADEQREHMKYLSCRQGVESVEWLHTAGKITPEEYERVKAIVDRRTPTSEELVRAIQSVRRAGLPGFVFFRYECMFEDRGQGVIGWDLWPRLQAAFAEAPAAP